MQQAGGLVSACLRWKLIIYYCAMTTKKREDVGREDE